MPTKEQSLVVAARAIAIKAHEGQTDRGGHPYIGHPEAVAKIAVEIARSEYTSNAELLAIIEALALLHDVVEDAPDEAERIRRCNRIERDCGVLVYRQVAALTHHPDETYAEYIGQVAAGPYTVRVVKRADLRHNGNLSRLAKPVLCCAACKTRHDDVGPRCMCTNSTAETTYANSEADRQRAAKYAVAELLLARCGTV